jgi:hypothetical protein
MFCISTKIDRGLKETRPVCDQGASNPSLTEKSLHRRILPKISFHDCSLECRATSVEKVCTELLARHPESHHREDDSSLHLIENDAQEERYYRLGRMSAKGIVGDRSAICTISTDDDSSLITAQIDWVRRSLVRRQLKWAILQKITVKAIIFQAIVQC